LRRPKQPPYNISTIIDLIRLAKQAEEQIIRDGKEFFHQALLPQEEVHQPHQSATLLMLDLEEAMTKKELKGRGGTSTSAD
jgi:hypothetical protein